MDFSLPPELNELRGRVRAFVDEHIIPAEQAIVDEDRAGSWATLRRLQGQAREAGLWTPHLPVELGGLGLGNMGMCVLFREMGRSLVGARVFNCDAPDQGNMDLLLNVASDTQRQRWLKPLCDAEITSGFSMTEPAPGAGSDPSNLKTTAVRDGDGWRIDGRKWFTTGGGDAAFLIVMARTSDDPREGATMFLVERDAPGVTHVRDVHTMAGPGLLVHKEAELVYDNVRVSDDAVLGGVGQGFRMAQKRLVPARLTHCMRWLGLADRALQMCRDYLKTRTSFGLPLAYHQMVQQKLADGAVSVHSGNLMTFHCAWMLEQGLDKQARPYSSMCKREIAQSVCRIVDDCIQLHGALGYSTDLPFAGWYRHLRAARIADGPDEVHTMVIARDLLKGRLELLV